MNRATENFSVEQARDAIEVMQCLVSNYRALESELRWVKSAQRAGITLDRLKEVRKSYADESYGARAIDSLIDEVEGRP